MKRKFSQYLKMLSTISFIFALIMFTLLGNSEEKKIKSSYDIYKKSHRWLNVEIYNAIRYYASFYKIPEKLVYAVIQQESGNYCNNRLSRMLRVKSCAGAIGLMQVMPFHLKDETSYWELYNYNKNIERGCWYLSKCLKRSKGKIVEACRMYNAGMNSKRYRYKNWEYVQRICVDYLNLQNQFLGAFI